MGQDIRSYTTSTNEVRQMSFRKPPFSIATLGLLICVVHAATGSNAVNAHAPARTAAIASYSDDDDVVRQSDFDGDGTVGFSDFVAFAGAFGLQRGNPAFDARYDLNGDDRIGFGDFVIFAGNFGKSAPRSGDNTSAFARRWNNVLPREDWWRESTPYSCIAEEKTSSPWIDAGLEDLGGGDPLSLIRWYGNGSYLRYAAQTVEGCTPTARYPGPHPPRSARRSDLLQRGRSRNMDRYLPICAVHPGPGK